MISWLAVRSYCIVLGMSRFTGGVPDSIDDMVSDESLMRSINSKINPSAEIVDMDGLSEDDAYEVIDRDNPVIDTIEIGGETITNPNGKGHDSDDSSVIDTTAE